MAIPRRSNIENSDGFALPVRELPSDALVPLNGRRIAHYRLHFRLGWHFDTRIAVREGDYSSSITTIKNNNNNSANFYDASTLYLIVESSQKDQTINVYFSHSHP